MIQIVTELLPSAHWVNASVIVLACGHRHVRPRGHVTIGAQFDCCFCDDPPEHMKPAIADAAKKIADDIDADLTAKLSAHSTARGE